MRSYRIVVIRGDGIGPEIVEAALEVLREVQERLGTFETRLQFEPGGAACYQQTGTNLSAETLEACRQADSVLKGPVGLPGVRLPDGTEAGLLGGVLRPGLDLYANVRPIKQWPGIRSPLDLGPNRINYVIVRENTEGLYASRGRGVSNRWSAADTLLMTHPGVERIVRFAFDLARRRNRAPADGARRVTCVDKSNVLKSYAFFRAIFDEIAGEYPDVEADYLYADAAAQALVLFPSRFDVLVMENFLGDILSDLGGATTGGIGLCPSGNIGEQGAYFEPIHGSAPALANLELANPLGQILSVAMMLDWLGETGAARSIELAVGRALESKALVVREDGCVEGGPRLAAAAVIDHLGSAD